MIDLRDALHEASSTDDLTMPDVRDLQRRADRADRVRRIGMGATVTAVAAMVALVALQLADDATPTVDIAAEPPATTDAGPDTAAASPDDPAGYAAWRARWQERLEADLEAATDAQQPALADGTITEQEWLTASADWQGCVQAAGYDFDLHREDPPPGAPPAWSYDYPAIPEQDMAAFDATVADCFHDHLRAIEALWREQQTNHVTWWNTLQRWEADQGDTPTEETP
ncbi:hypothetical protein [Salsipaludibacter albus]|uniref:hypothetical protein n=1 Tax=Salsipaludibacter albus TaxID=2849650 RepID=UPI001EE43880|nr:hypothetical protein [Salsipaludibacter albus]MBY5163706.1 hypothetical protein [Salsipaludibacter albus]